MYSGDARAFRPPNLSTIKHRQEACKYRSIICMVLLDQVEHTESPNPIIIVEASSLRCVLHMHCGPLQDAAAADCQVIRGLFLLLHSIHPHRYSQKPLVCPRP